MENNEIPENVWTDALVYQKEDTRYYRMDTIWDCMAKLRRPDGTVKFKRLSKIALLILTLPHSNAEEERVFSMVTKNKTKFRPNLQLDTTLSSILTVKLANPTDCIKFEPTKQILDTAKKATVEYNKEHRKN